MYINSNQKEDHIAIPKSMVENLMDGKSSISEYDFLIYLTLRNWAKNCSDLDEARRICDVCDEAWVYELNAYLINMRGLCNYLYDLAKATRITRTALVKQNLSHLICTGYVICYNRKLGVSYSATEFMNVCESDEWEDGRDIFFYFPVQAGFFYLPGRNVDKVINYCRDQKKLGEKNDHPEYYVALYAILEYHFNISKKPGACYLRSPRSTRFTSRRKLWDRVDDILSIVGIYHDYKRGVDAVGNIATEQLFFNSEAAYSNYQKEMEEHIAYFASKVDGPGVDLKLEIESHPPEKVGGEHMLIHDDMDFINSMESSVERQIAISLVNGLGLAPTMSSDMRRIQNDVLERYEEFCKNKI